MALTVYATVNGVQVALAEDQQNPGTFSAQLTAPSLSSFHQTGGFYNVAISASDDYGNTLQADHDDIAGLALYAKENVKPVITITSPGNNAMLTNNTPTLTFNVTDNDSGVKKSTLVVKVDGTAVSSSGITWSNITGGFSGSLALSTLSDGSHTITVDIDDNDGNHAVQASSSVTVDTTPPSLNVTSPTPDGMKTNTQTLTVTGTTNDATSSPVTVQIKLNGTDQGTVTVDGQGNFSKVVTLASGANTIYVKATDNAGKYSEITRTVHYKAATYVVSSVSLSPGTQANPADVGGAYTLTVTITEAT